MGENNVCLMRGQEDRNTLIPYIERQRLAFCSQIEDDLDFYQELYTILKAVPTEIWERLGFERVREVRVYPNLEHPTRDMSPVSLRVWIYYDGIRKAELYDFERMDCPWANLARHWRPYRNFLTKEMRLAIQRMEGIEEEQEENGVPNADLQSRLNCIPIVNKAEEENQLRSYIEELSLYPQISSECRRQNASRVRELRRIMTDVTVASIIDMVEREDCTGPEIIQLREYRDYVCRREGEEARDALIRFLLCSPKSIDELNQAADELIVKVREGAIGKVPGLQYLFDHLGISGKIRRETLCLENLKRSALENIMMDFIYLDKLLCDIEIAFRIIIYGSEDEENLGLIKKVIFPFSDLDEKKEIWTGLREAAEIYKCHENLQYTDYEVVVEIPSEGETYIARMPLLDAQEKGKTEDEAREKLQSKFEKDHLKWITVLAVTIVFGKRQSETT